MFSRGRQMVALSLSQAMPEEVTTARRSKRKRIRNRRLLFDEVCHFLFLVYQLYYLYSNLEINQQIKD